MEALPGGCYDAAGDGETALGAEGAGGADGAWGVVWTGC
jgi:hypothetical protein